MKKSSGAGKKPVITEAPQSFHGVVRGRVQGVGYRVFAREAAVRHRVTGWVRNRPDGTVEVQAEGTETQLTEFLTELYRGPIIAHVQDIQLTWESAEGNHTSFEILR